MNKEQLIKQFLDKPYALDMGANKVARWWNSDPTTVKEARKEVRKILFRASPKAGMPKILILDIETAPLKGYIWSRWQQNIYPDQLISDWFMLTWSAKWLLEPKMFHDRLIPTEIKNEDDSRISKSMWDLLDQADIVVTHNGDRFDLPRLNARFLVNGLLPPAPYQSVDTKKVFSRQFGFSSNKLSELARALGFKEGKMDTDFELWSASMDGSQEAIKTMQDYCDQDVYVLEELYVAVRAWIKGHPNVGLFLESEVPVCRICGSTHLTPTHKDYYTSVSKFGTLRCECGAVSKQRKNKYPKDLRKELLGVIYR